MKECDTAKYPDRFCQAAFSIEDGSGFLEVGFQIDGGHSLIIIS